MSLNQKNLAEKRRSLSKLLLEKDLSKDTLLLMRSLMTNSGKPAEDEKREAMAVRIAEVITSSKTEKEIRARLQAFNTQA